MGDGAGAAMGWFAARCCAAIGFVNRLVAEANSEDGGGAAELFDKVDAYACFLRRARTGGDNNGCGRERGDLFDAHFIIADDTCFARGCGGAQADMSREVLDKAVIVIND